jgi:hypothetical protein
MGVIRYLGEWVSTLLSAQLLTRLRFSLLLNSSMKTRRPSMVPCAQPRSIQVKVVNGNWVDLIY